MVRPKGGWSVFSRCFPRRNRNGLGALVAVCRYSVLGWKRLSSNFRVLLWEFANPLWARLQSHWREDLLRTLRMYISYNVRFCIAVNA
ncbi:unnamed protein product [Malus baccata var. baccata]